MVRLHAPRATYTYDLNGNRTNLFHPHSIWFSTDYDGHNRPWRIREPDNGPIATMAYDAPGRPASLGFLGGSGAGFGYDGVSRLSSLAHNLDGASHDAAWTYARNPASQLASAARDNDAYAWTGHYAASRAYTTDGLNRYSQTGSAAFGYDLNGNLVSDGMRTFTYDVEKIREPPLHLRIAHAWAAATFLRRQPHELAQARRCQSDLPV